MFFTIRGKTLTFYLRLVLPALAIIFIVTTLLLRIASNTPYPASAAGPVVFHGTVSPLVAQNHLIGPADPNQRISLTIGLRPRNAEGLTRYAQDISNPKSVNFHRYLTSANVADVFGPTPAAHVAVLKFLQEYGLTITQTYKHRLLISFSGTISQIEQAFHVTINNYSALDGHIFYANTNDPTLPASIVGVVQSISGLNNATLLHHSTLSIHNITMPKSLPHTLKCPGPGSGIPGTSNSYLIPNQIATAYNLTGLYNAGYKGEGQTMALFELGTFQMNDLTSYISCFGNNHAAIQTVVTGQGKVPTDSGVLEVELDAELALSAAPQLGLLRIYEAANDIADYNAEWARIIQDAPPVVSTSWGDCEPAIGLQEAQQENIFFTVAAAQGQSIFSASGDGGSIGCYLDNPPSPYQLWGDPDDPASQPFVTGVGGTTLFYTGHYNSEATWNDTATPGGGASGGGKSSFWIIPSWQNAPSIVYAPGDGYPCKSPPNGLCREVPDVSLSADPNNGYIIYCSSVAAHCAGSGNWYTVGGTSAAAPMWAAMMVLTNEMSLKMGGFNLGFINPLLYQISNNASSYSSSFHDVYIGHNDVAGMSAHEYDAGPNYDMATGLGSYNAFALATNLVSLAQSTNGTRTSPANTTWYFAEGIVGGGFQEFLTMQNPSPVQAASINVTYLFQSRSAITIAHTVPASSRFTVYVNQDLGIPPTATQQPISAIVQVTNGPGIVVERPMYFKFKGIQSGTDVIGATSPGTSYYFPEADTRQSGSTYYTYITMLNPSSTLTANATVGNLLQWFMRALKPACLCNTNDCSAPTS
ncbi:MAG: S53 family peptidase [Ktedonobacteraceae bacterium]